MKILVVEPHKAPRVDNIPCDYRDMQKVVEGDIACIYPWNDPVGLVHNDNAIAEGKPVNRVLFSRSTRYFNIIRGTFFLAGLSEEDFTDLPDNLIEKYSALFASPESILLGSDGKITIVQVDVE